ncbi:MAG: hypothetical protein ACXWUG_13390 [Polyangiales bacterium]
MRTVTALDLRTGAAVVLMATASCFLARSSDPTTVATSADHRKIEPIGDVAPGAVVFVDWAGRWSKMLVR